MMSIVDCCLIIFRAKPILQCTINLSFVGINYCRNINMRRRRRRRSVVVVPFLLTSPVATTDSTSLSSLHVSFSCLSVSVVNHSSSRLYIADHVREAKRKASVINRWLLLFEPSRAEPIRSSDMVNGIRYSNSTPQHSLRSRYVKNTSKYIEPVGVFIGDDHMKWKAGYLVGPDHDIKLIGGGWRSDAMVMVWCGSTSLAVGWKS